MRLIDGLFFLSMVSIPFIFIHMLINIYEWYRDSMLIRTGVETTGTVVDEIEYHSDPDDSSPSQYTRVIASYSVKNKTYYLKSRFRAKKHIFLDQQMTILYNPEDPENGRFKSDDSLFSGVRNSFILLVTAIACLIYTYTKLNM